MINTNFDQSGNKHLEYYTALNVSPVTYFNRVFSDFIQQRKILYDYLGCPRAMVRDRHVLEIAAGSGQNSIFTSLQAPTSLTLIEPNHKAYQQILLAYSLLQDQHTLPEVKNLKFEDFFYEHSLYSTNKFHLVICENWLGNSSYDSKLRRDQSTLVEKDGIYITTFMSPFGILPNIIRRLLIFFITRNISNFDEKISLSLYSLQTHLATIRSMNRSHTDWIIDNMLHPGYLDVVVTIIDLLEDLGNEFDIFSTYPQYTQEAKFFKSFTTNDSKTNSYIDSYYRFCHCFVDYEDGLYPGFQAVNKKVEALVSDLICAVKNLEISNLGDYCERRKKVLSLLEEMKPFLREALSLEAYNALMEGIEVCFRDNVNASEVRGLSKFSSLFGRETFYISFIRK